MLTAKENMRACVLGGEPERYVNQYEGISLLVAPSMMLDPPQKKGDPDIVNSWGVTRRFPENVPGGFPVHTPEKIVVKDIEHWQDYVHGPKISAIPQGLWDVCQNMYAGVDGS